jgi:hypothetical protein
MWRTFAYFINLLLLLTWSLIQVHAQDSIPIPLKIKIGMEVSGPAIYYTDKNILNTEGYISVDLDEKHSAVLAAGYLDYKYSQYNYYYLNNGSFVRIGMDFNLLKPDKSLGKYYAGIGLRYGLSRFSSEIPSFEKQNYWGTASSSIPRKINWGNFIEVSPGVRAEIFNHFSVGWSISLRMLLYTNTGKDLRPVYFPGYGNGTKTISSGLNYFIVWNIPFKKINVILKKEAKEETDDNDETNTNSNDNNSTTGTSGNNQNGKDMR